MIFLEARLEDALEYIKKSNDQYLNNYQGKSSALADPQFAVGYLRYLLSKNLEVQPEFELALFKNRSLDYAKRYIDLLKQYNKTPSDTFLSRISKTHLKDYYRENSKKETINQPSVSSFNITLTPLMNTDLSSLIREAIDISKKLGTDLSFMFHSTEINVTPTSKYDELYKLISEKITKINK